MKKEKVFEGLIPEIEKAAKFYKPRIKVKTLDQIIKALIKEKAPTNYYDL